MQVEILSIKPSDNPGTLDVVLRRVDAVEHYSFTPKAIMIAEQQAYLFNGDDRFEQTYAQLPGLSQPIYQLVKDVFFGKTVNLPVIIDDSVLARQSASK